MRLQLHLHAPALVDEARADCARSSCAAALVHSSEGLPRNLAEWTLKQRAHCCTAAGPSLSSLPVMPAEQLVQFTAQSVQVKPGALTAC